MKFWLVDKYFYTSSLEGVGAVSHEVWEVMLTIFFEGGFSQRKEASSCCLIDLLILQIPEEFWSNLNLQSESIGNSTGNGGRQRLRSVATITHNILYDQGSYMDRNHFS